MQWQQQQDRKEKLRRDLDEQLAEKRRLKAAEERKRQEEELREVRCALRPPPNSPRPRD